MKVVNNWQDMWKAYSVTVPALMAAIVAVLAVSTDVGHVPAWIYPIVVVISSFFSRIIQQRNLGANNVHNTRR